MTAVTYGGQADGTRSALRGMRARGRGVIVNVSPRLRTGRSHYRRPTAEAGTP